MKFLPDIHHCVYWVLAEVWASDKSHKIGNKSFIRHCQGWKQGSIVCETIWFFSWVNTHPFDLEFVAFCPKFSGDSWEEFQEKKNYSGRIFQKFCVNQGYPLPKLVKYRPIFCNFILGPYCAEKNSHKHFHMVFATRQGGTSINESQKEATGRKAKTFCFRKIGFVHSRFGTYYALLLGYFGLNFLLDIRHCVYWVLTEVWALDSSTKIDNKSFIRHSQGWKESSFVWNYLIFFVDEYSSIWPEICRGLYQIQWRFLGGISGKNYSGRIFQKFCANQGYIFYRNLWNSGLISAISLWVRIALKKIHTSIFLWFLHPGKEARP